VNKRFDGLAPVARRAFCQRHQILSPGHPRGFLLSGWSAIPESRGAPQHRQIRHLQAPLTGLPQGPDPLLGQAAGTFSEIGMPTDLGYLGLVPSGVATTNPHQPGHFGVSGPRGIRR
jgi:hypothetical protein